MRRGAALIVLPGVSSIFNARLQAPVRLSARAFWVIIQGSEPRRFGRKHARRGLRLSSAYPVCGLTPGEILRDII